MPAQEKTPLPHQYSVRSSDVPTSETPPEASTEVEVVKSESDISEIPEENPCSVDEGEEEDDDDSVKSELLVPYSIALLHQVLAFLISITNPSKFFRFSFLMHSTSLSSLRYGLSTINILLEMNGDVFVNYQPLIELLQGNFCKFLIQNSQSEDTSILSLALRVIFNLFQGLKSFLKVQLEVFFTSVHIRLADM